jgi:outer membrane protein assembly factor BamB
VRARVAVFTVAMAIVFALPIPPARAAKWTSPIWEVALHGAPWGLAGDAKGVVVTTDAGSVEAVAANGASRWHVTVEGISDGQPALSPATVLVGATNRVVALSRVDGHVQWETDMVGDVTSVALAGDTAVVGDHAGHLRALDIADGRTRWEVHWESEVWAPARIDVATSSVVAIWHQDPTPAARGFDLATGALRWEWPVGRYAAAPGFDHGRAFIGGAPALDRGWVEDIDPITGESRWAVTFTGSFQSAIVPAVDTHDVVLVDQHGLAFSIDPVSGAPRWTRDVGGRVLATQIVLLRRRVVLTTLDGDLVVLDRASGRVVARASPHDLGGLPLVAAAVGSRDRVAVALRLTVPAVVEVLRVP